MISMYDTCAMFIFSSFFFDFYLLSSYAQEGGGMIMGFGIMFGEALSHEALFSFSSYSLFSYSSSRQSDFYPTPLRALFL